MHRAAYRFVAEHRGNPRSVIEIGSRDINGTIRGLFDGATYVGLDLYEGPSVDWVGSALDYAPEERVEAVVCCEVLEHAAEWREIVTVGAGWLKPGGALIVTCAGPNRRPHSALDGKHRLHPGEHYGNITAAELRSVIEQAGMEVEACREHRRGEDTQAVARKR